MFAAVSMEAVARHKGVVNTRNAEFQVSMHWRKQESCENYSCTKQKKFKSTDNMLVSYCFVFGVLHTICFCCHHAYAVSVYHSPTHT